MTIEYRVATLDDVAGMAHIRADEWGTEENWIYRITGYLNGTVFPQKALAPRVGYVALENGIIIGFIAGHLTRRLDCDGELEWINVTPSHRRQGVAFALLCLLAEWFVEQHAPMVCIDVVADNTPAQNFYRKHGAVNLDAHWLYWKDISVVLQQ